MYDHFEGEVRSVRPARVVLHAAGIGFELEVPTSTSGQVATGTTVKLYSLLHVVDGVPSLLGFADRGDRELARALLSVSGVGKAMTLALLSTYTPAELAHAIQSGDITALKRVKGVGAKTAERLCLELRDKVAKLELRGRVTSDDPVPSEPAPPAASDAIAALVTLGYAEKDARTRVDKTLTNQPDASTEDLIKSVLRG